jgi:chromosome segregation protein
VARVNSDLAACSERSRAAAGEIAVLRGAVESAAAAERRAVTSLQSLECELQPLEASLREEEAHFTAQREAFHRATQQLAQAQTVCDTARGELEGAVRELEVLRAQVAAELRCGLEELPDEPVPHGSLARVKTLRAQLAAIGPVNARADEDYAGAGERLAFLRAQSTDLHDGVARLRAIIEDANATVRDRFASTVEELDKQFSGYFSRLFGGGSCRLVAQYDERGLPSGVEVSAQPPGKRARDLALLSGGERALVAMALLFAMLKVRPVPFCLLDEVEAALDEANTGRFGAILREMSSDTQFILVTHNRGTMLQADRLYGVTMSEAGVSNVVSLEMQGEAG